MKLSFEKRVENFKGRYLPIIVIVAIILSLIGFVLVLSGCEKEMKAYCRVACSVYAAEKRLVNYHHLARPLLGKRNNGLTTCLCSYRLRIPDPRVKVKVEYNPIRKVPAEKK